MRRILPLLAILAIATGVAAVGYTLSGRPPVVTQPIAFNHALHLDAAGLQCADCHLDAAVAARAGLPGKEVCLGCHSADDEVEDGSELAKLTAYADRAEDLPWVRVAVTKPDVFFSHRRHVAAGGIECQRCHPGQQSLTAPPRSAQLVMKMDDCIECHKQRGVSTDCLVCHR